MGWSRENRKRGVIIVCIYGCLMTGVFLMRFSQTHLCPRVILGLPVTVDLVHSLNVSFRKEWVFFVLCIVIGSAYHQVEVIIVVTPVLQLRAIPSLSRTYCICHATAVKCLFFSLLRILPSFWQKLLHCSHPACLAPKGNGKQDSGFCVKYRKFKGKCCWDAQSFQTT